MYRMLFYATYILQLPFRQNGACYQPLRNCIVSAHALVICAVVSQDNLFYLISIHASMYDGNYKMADMVMGHGLLRLETNNSKARLRSTLATTCDLSWEHPQPPCTRRRAGVSRSTHDLLPATGSDLPRPVARVNCGGRRAI